MPGCLNHHTEGNYSGGLNGHIDLPDTGGKSKFVLYKATETRKFCYRLLELRKLAL